jgi:hypothetical protein
MPQLPAVVVGAQPDTQGALKDLVQAHRGHRVKVMLAEILQAKVVAAVAAIVAQELQVV